MPGGINLVSSSPSRTIAPQRSQSKTVSFSSTLGLTLVAGLVATVGSLASCGKKGKQVITATTGGLPAPFIVTLDSEEGSLYKTKDGVYLAGYDIAVITEVFKTDYFADYELDFRVAAFATALTDAQQGVVDFTINNWSYNDSRKDSYYFSYPYTKTRYEIISKKGTSYSSFDEVAAAGKKVQSSAGNNVANAIERWNEANPSKRITLEYVESNTTQDQLQKIVDGDYVGIGDLPVYESYKKEFPSLFAQIDETYLSSENAKAITVNTINIYDLLRFETLVIDVDSVKTLEEVYA